MVSDLKDICDDVLRDQLACLSEALSLETVKCKSRSVESEHIAGLVVNYGISNTIVLEIP